MAEHDPNGVDPRAARRKRMLRRRRRSMLGTLTLLFAVLAACQLITAAPNEAENVDAAAGDPGPLPSASHPARGAGPRRSTAAAPSASTGTRPHGHASPSASGTPQSSTRTASPQQSPRPTSSALRPRPDLQVEAASGELRVVPGTGPVRGTGPVKRYVVEVERGLPERPDEFAAAVARILADPRSWGHDGTMSFQRVSSGPVDFRVTLASPAETDRLCAVAGLDTEGKVSCFNGSRSVINQNRWETAVPWFDGDVALYRDYVVNHEVGHALGHHHEHCAAKGRLAPVMQEQTYTLEGCRKNGWPYPHAG